MLVKYAVNRFLSEKKHTSSYTITNKSCMKSNARVPHFEIPTSIKRYSLNFNEVSMSDVTQDMLHGEYLTQDLIYNIRFTHISNIKTIILELNGNPICSINVFNNNLERFPCFNESQPLLNSYLTRNFNMLYFNIIPIDKEKKYSCNLVFDYKHIGWNSLRGQYLHVDEDIDKCFVYSDGMMVKRYTT